MFSSQICPAVEDFIVNLEQGLQATNGIAAGYIFKKTIFIKTMMLIATVTKSDMVTQ